MVNVIDDVFVMFVEIIKEELKLIIEDFESVWVNKMKWFIEYRDVIIKYLLIFNDLIVKIIKRFIIEIVMYDYWFLSIEEWFCLDILGFS